MWTGKDQVFWNGESMSRKRRFFGSKHVFRVFNPETGNDDTFYVRISIGLNGTTYGVRRNDKTLLGTWKDQLTHQNRAKMPDSPGLNLDARPRSQPSAEPQPTGGWREEDLIV
jgi:hypothetical protein